MLKSMINGFVPKSKQNIMVKSKDGLYATSIVTDNKSFALLWFDPVRIQKIMEAVESPEMQPGKFLAEGIETYLQTIEADMSFPELMTPYKSDGGQSWCKWLR